MESSPRPSLHGLGALGRDALFLRSGNPMLLANDDRRYVDVNTAACLFLRIPREDLLALRVDDLTPPEQRPQMNALWAAFLRDGVQAGTFTLLAPDGGRVMVDYSATANFGPGKHLSVFVFPAVRQAAVSGAARSGALTTREREVLTLVALGRTGPDIAETLHISVATVQTHINNAIRRLHAVNRAHAITIAIRTGELEPHTLDQAIPRRLGS